MQVRIGLFALASSPSPAPSGVLPGGAGVTPEKLYTAVQALPVIAACLAGACVVLVLVAVVLRLRAPRAYWLTFGWLLLAARMRLTWRRLTLNAGMAATDRPMTGLFDDRRGVRGRPAVPLIPVLWQIRPRPFGVTASIGMHSGQTPEVFVKAAEAMAHAWGVHAVRVTPGRRGSVNVAVLRTDPLTDATDTVTGMDQPSLADPGTAPVASDLRAEVGHREDGLTWVIDLGAFPHWLITGATRSGKSTLINAAIARWAGRPIALVGIDCKGGMELAPHASRLSALACDRTEAADVLTGLIGEAEDRMRLCREHEARNIWQLPDAVRPVPVIVIVDELAELYLVADRSEKEVAQRATANLLRLGQLGAALGIHLVIAGQRVGSDLGPGVTALRAQLAGRVCLRVNDEETADMTLGDLHPDAVDAAQTISPFDHGVAITTADASGWIRARSIYQTPADLDAAVAATSHLTPRLPRLDR